MRGPIRALAGAASLAFLLVTVRWVGAQPPADAPADSLAAGGSGSKFVDPEDGWFDISAFLSSPGGFAPIVVPITEPAVGYRGSEGVHRSRLLRRRPLTRTVYLGA